MKRYVVYLMIAGVIGLIAWPASAAGRGGNHATGVISVSDTVHGGYTTATVNPGGAEIEVFVRCYAPTFGGRFVYAAYFDVDGSNHASIGPLWSTLWTNGDASCTAEEGYVRRAGNDRWITVATTTFEVSAS
jgi:hypothetical protein